MIFPSWPGSYPPAGQRQCFHVTPFRPWSERTSEVLRQVSKRKEIGMRYVRGDEVLDPNIIRSIWDSLCQSSHVVVDLTGLNPNVTLELGMAHTMGRKTLIITQDSKLEEYFPSIAKVRMHSYSLQDARGTQNLESTLAGFFLS